MGRGTRRWVMAAGIGALAVLALAIVAPPGTISGLFIRVPRSHDQRLVGTWLSDDDTRAMTVFLPDGSGWSSFRRRLRGKFQWGTDEGVLFTKRMETDSWSSHRWKYTLDPSGAEATFLGDRSDLVRFHMRRATTKDLAALAPRVGETGANLFATLGPADSSSQEDGPRGWVFTYTWPHCRVKVVEDRVSEVTPK